MDSGGPSLPLHVEPPVSCTVRLYSYLSSLREDANANACVRLTHVRWGMDIARAAVRVSRSVNDLKPRSPVEDMDRLWCRWEQIKGGQNERRGPLSAVERSSHGTEPASFASNHRGRRRRREEEERDTHTRRPGERILLISLMLNPNITVFYICLSVQQVKDL